jgi:hypothetical protein
MMAHFPTPCSKSFLRGGLPAGRSFLWAEEHGRLQTAGDIFGAADEKRGDFG